MPLFVCFSAQDFEKSYEFTGLKLLCPAVVVNPYLIQSVTDCICRCKSR